MKVLFVCLGNICRSPMAEGVLRALAKADNVDLEIDSAGTADYHVGEKADVRARKIMAEKGMAIEDLRARQFKQADFDRFDRIFAMDEQNRRDMLSLARTDSDRAKVSLYLDYGSALDKNVPDPYYGSDAGFDQVFELLTESTQRFLSQLHESR